MSLHSQVDLLLRNSWQELNQRINTIARFIPPKDQLEVSYRTQFCNGAVPYRAVSALGMGSKARA